LITENVSTLKINMLTQAQYDREHTAGRIDANALYLTPDNDPKIVRMTQEEYDSALANGEIDESTIYLIPDKEWSKVTNTATSIEVVAEDKIEYYFPNAQRVEINLPTNLTNYECWVFVGGANATILVNGGTCLGITDYDGSYSTSCAEISIKDGRYIIATDYII
jgi:hypothetical protein